MTKYIITTDWEEYKICKDVDALQEDLLKLHNEGDLNDCKVYELGREVMVSLTTKVELDFNMAGLLKEAVKPKHKVKKSRPTYTHELRMKVADAYQHRNKTGKTAGIIAKEFRVSVASVYNWHKEFWVS
jgi:hypothetical protein